MLRMLARSLHWLTARPKVVVVSIRDLTCFVPVAKRSNGHKRRGLVDFTREGLVRVSRIVPVSVRLSLRIFSHARVSGCDPFPKVVKAENDEEDVFGVLMGCRGIVLPTAFDEVEEALRGIQVE